MSPKMIVPNAIMVAHFNTNMILYKHKSCTETWQQNLEVQPRAAAGEVNAAIPKQKRRGHDEPR